MPKPTHPEATLPTPRKRGRPRAVPAAPAPASAQRAIHPRLLSPRDATIYCSLSRSTLYRLAAEGRITIRKFGERRALVDVASLDAYIEQHALSRKPA